MISPYIFYIMISAYGHSRIYNMCQNHFMVCWVEKGHYTLREEGRPKPQFMDLRFEQNNAMARSTVKTLGDELHNSDIL